MDTTTTLGALAATSRSKEIMSSLAQGVATSSEALKEAFEILASVAVQDRAGFCSTSTETSLSLKEKQGLRLNELRRKSLRRALDFQLQESGVELQLSGMSCSDCGSSSACRDSRRVGVRLTPQGQRAATVLIIPYVRGKGREFIIDHNSSTPHSTAREALTLSH